MTIAVAIVVGAVVGIWLGVAIYLMRLELD